MILNVFFWSPQLPAVSFSVQNLPFTEPMLAVWAQLVSLAGSKLEKQRMKKSLSRGLTGTESATQTDGFTNGLTCDS